MNDEREPGWRWWHAALPLWLLAVVVGLALATTPATRPGHPLCKAGADLPGDVGCYLMGRNWEPVAKNCVTFNGTSHDLDAYCLPDSREIWRQPNDRDNNTPLEATATTNPDGHGGGDW